MVKSLKLIIEALLFTSDKPLNPVEIREYVPDATLSEIKSALRVLKFEYEAMGRSFSLKEVAEGFQLRTHSDYGSYILNMLRTSPNRLSRAALETLSIIAYKQPILRQEIEKYRGVDVGGILKTLLEKGLIRIMGRKDLPGKPLIYGTTKKFLEVFDLKDLNSLPKLKEIQSLGADELESRISQDAGQILAFVNQEDFIKETKDPPLEESADPDFTASGTVINESMEAIPRNGEPMERPREDATHEAEETQEPDIPEENSWVNLPSEKIE